MPFSARALEENIFFDVDIVVKKKGETTFYWEKMKDYKFVYICKWESKITDVIFNLSGAELRIQDGGAYKSATMLENSIEEDLGSISLAPKMSRNFKNQYIV